MQATKLAILSSNGSLKLWKLASRPWLWKWTLLLYRTMRLNTEINQNYWHFFKVSDYQDCDTRIKRKVFSTESTFTSVSYSIENFVLEMKPVFMEKHDIEYRKNWILIAVFGIFGLFWFQCKDWSCGFFNWILLYKCEAFDWNFDGRNQTSSFWGSWFWMSR